MAWFLCKKGGSSGIVPVNPVDTSAYDLYIAVGDRNVVDETINNTYSSGDVIGTALYDGAIYDTYHVSGSLNNNYDSQGVVALKYKFYNSVSESEEYLLGNHNYIGAPVDKFEFDTSINVSAADKATYTGIVIYFVATTSTVTLTADRHTVVDYY